MKEAYARNDIKKFVRELSYIADKGTLEEKKTMWAYFQDVVHTEYLKTKSQRECYSNGMRWTQESKDFLASQKLMGGKRIVNSTRFNIGGPHIDTIQKHLRRHQTRLVSGMNSLSNFESVAKHWGGLIKDRKHKYPAEKNDSIIVELSEDESGMVPNFEYDPENDSIFGACGWRDPLHKCDPSFKPVRSV